MTKTKYIDITKAEYAGDYKLRLTFSDSSKKIVDFKPFLQRARNPMIKKYLNLKEFKKFKLDFGDLTWNHFELCFPIEKLYEGRIN